MALCFQGLGLNRILPPPEEISEGAPRAELMKLGIPDRWTGTPSPGGRRGPSQLGRQVPRAARPPMQGGGPVVSNAPPRAQGCAINWLRNRLGVCFSKHEPPPFGPILNLLLDSGQVCQASARFGRTSTNIGRHRRLQRAPWVAQRAAGRTGPKLGGGDKNGRIRHDTARIWTRIDARGAF